MSTFRINTWTHFRPTALVAVLLLLVCMPVSTAAQSYERGGGIVRAAHWPDKPVREASRIDVLPFIDTLSVRYDFHADAGHPVLLLKLDWTSSGKAIYDGRRTTLSGIDGEVRMVAVELEADVVVEGLPATRFSLVVDSMVVGPYPDAVEVNLPDLTWENVFVDASPEEARHIFEKGFRLEGLKIVSAAFAVFGDDGRAAEARRGGRAEKPSRPRSVTVYPAAGTVDVVFDLVWLLGRPVRWFEPGPGAPRTVAGRGASDADRRSRAKGDRSARDDVDDRSSEAGRSDRDDRGDAVTREGRALRLPKRGDGGDDEDDDDRLVPYALAAVGAAGLLAVAGGTVGYYGNSRYAPFGLTSGLVRKDGGLLLQAGVNGALLFGEDRPKRLVAKMLAFGNVLDSRIQPAVGAGVLATSRRGESIDYEPSISVGAVAQYDMLLLFGAYDVIHNGPEFGLALNFRQLGLWRSREAQD